jgi:magnesium-protoporphyrin IX monomethyl ester (oxidative) cyclase
MSHVDVCLVNMPYACLERPSIALGLLKTYIQNAGYSVNCIYGNLKFAKVIGSRQFYAIEGAKNADLIGEWTFSQAAFPDHPRDIESLAESLGYLSAESCQNLLTTQANAELFINDLAEEIVAQSPKIVGCTSTFQQNNASLALLRQIKALDPTIVTLMGGANCEGCMGQTISDAFDWVDHVFSGESDEVIGDFIDGLIQGVKFTPLNLPTGVISRTHQNLITNASGEVETPRAVVNDMVNVGKPTYDDYFACLAELELEQDINPGLLVETSRGCWWGAKRHCTFCGLNGSGMDHRAKDAKAVLAELEQLSNTYGKSKFEVVDNILPMEYMKTLLPELDGKGYSLFYETKANLSEQQVEKFANAGIRWIQPGIESLHDGFLRLVKKGCTAVQNLATLKWCRQYNIRVAWNMLYNAPGEDQNWYNEMASWLGCISHLQPPQPTLCMIGYPRYSPYVNEPETFGLELKACPNYQLVYPTLDEQQIENIAYFFVDSSNTSKLDPNNSQGYDLMTKALGDWHDQFWCQGTQPVLCMFDQGDHIKILDTRAVATKLSHELRGVAMDIHRICEKPVSRERVLKKLQLANDGVLPEDAEAVLDQLVADKLIIDISHSYINLALKGVLKPLPETKEYPGGYLSLNEDTHGWKELEI